MKDSLLFILKAYRDYTGSGMYMALYYFALLIIWKMEEEKKNRDILLYPFLIMFGLVWNPAVAGLFFRRVMSGDTEGRIYWIFCMIPVIVYAAVKCILREKQKKERWLTLAVTLVLLCVCGTFKLSDSIYEKAENEYRLPQEMVDICDAVLADSDQETPRMAVPYDLSSFPRQYDLRIKLLYGENITFRITPETDPVIIAAYDEMQKDTPDLQVLTDALGARDCDYLVLYKEQCEPQELAAYGYEELYASEACYLYKKL